MHKKDILFLISLPYDIKAGMKISYTEYISILRSIERIELRESISQSDLAIAGQFPLVVIVGHNNVSEESLILENGTLLPWASIISYLPVPCTNTIDIGACKAKLGEKSVADAIKEHCPNIRRVLSPKKATKVEGRLMLYREMLPSIDLDKDYYEVYSSKVAELQHRIIQLREGRKDKTETLQGTKLGTESSEDVKTSVFFPNEVVRGEFYKLQIILHLDVDTGTLYFDIAKGNDPITAKRKTNVALKNVHKGDCLLLNLSFLDGENRRSTKQIIVDERDELTFEDDHYTKEIIVNDEDKTEIPIHVKVNKDYNDIKFFTLLKLLKDYEVSSFEFDTYIKSGDSQISNNAEVERRGNDRGNQNKFIRDPEMFSPQKGGEIEKRVLQAMKKVVEGGFIVNKQDWAAVYIKIRNEKILYLLTIAAFVRLIKSQEFPSEIVPQSGSNIEKLAYYNSKKGQWRLYEMKSKDEDNRLIKLADIFFDYYQKQP